MASLKRLALEGRSGFLPDWEEYSGRAFSWRVKTRVPGGSVKTWNIGDWFYQPSDCDELRTRLSRRDWRGYVASGLMEDSEEVSVEIVYKEFDRGEPRGRLSVLRGTTYPVVKRNGRQVILWTKGASYEKEERLPPLNEDDVFNARISKTVGWYVFVWDDESSRWEHVASFAKREHLDEFVSSLRERGRKVCTAEKPKP